MTILFVHGWKSTPGGLKPAQFKDHCQTVANPVLSERLEQRRLVRDAITALERQTSVISFLTVELGWLEGHSVRDVADSLDLTAAQVRYRQYRAKKKLRRLLRLRIT